MKTFRVILSFGVLATLSQAALAHHGVSEYDYKSTVITKVTVARYEWANPHCKIHFDAADLDGKIEDWVIEAHPPANMTEHGWTRQTLRPGDEVTLHFRPGKAGGAQGLLVKAVFPNGRELLQNVLLLPPGNVYSLQDWQKVRTTIP